MVRYGIYLFASMKFVNATDPSHIDSVTDPCELTRRSVLDCARLYCDLEREKLVPTIVNPRFDNGSLRDAVARLSGRLNLNLYLHFAESLDPSFQT